MKPYLGCHLSTTGGFAATVRTAESIGANTFAFFTRNPRGSKAKAEDPADAAAAMELLRDGAFGPLVAHGAYTMNLCTATLAINPMRITHFHDVCLATAERAWFKCFCHSHFAFLPQFGQ